MTCLIPGCPNEDHSKGLCTKHYGRAWRISKGMIPHEVCEKKPDLGKERAELEAEIARLDGLIRKTPMVSPEWKRRISERRKVMEMLEGCK